MAAAQDNLIRKQFLVSRDQAKKIETMAKSKGSSVAEIVRQAIDAYDPEAILKGGENEMLELAIEQVQDAIKVTQGARRRLKKTRQALKKAS
jgi:hypothetical protein